MPFSASSLPPLTRAEFLKAQSAPILWPVVVQQGVREGIKDATKLTDIVFYLHHPERIGKPLQSFETKLIEEWKAFRTLVKPAIPYWAKPAAPSEPAAPATPNLADLLRGVDTESLGKSTEQRAHLAKMRDFFVRGLEGETIDDSYWQFTYFDGFGRERNCAEKHSLLSVKRIERKQKALSNFKRCAEGSTTSAEVGKCLYNTEGAVYCQTFVVIRWTTLNAATGDGPLREYTEYGYLKELAGLAKQSYPPTIYSCYKDEIVTTYMHA